MKTLTVSGSVMEIAEYYYMQPRKQPIRRLDCHKIFNVIIWVVSNSVLSFTDSIQTYSASIFRPFLLRICYIFLFLFFPCYRWCWLIWRTRSNAEQKTHHWHRYGPGPGRDFPWRLSWRASRSFDISKRPYNTSWKVQNISLLLHFFPQLQVASRISVVDSFMLC